MNDCIKLSEAKIGLIRGHRATVVKGVCGIDRRIVSRLRRERPPARSPVVVSGRTRILSAARDLDSGTGGTHPRVRGNLPTDGAAWGACNPPRSSCGSPF